ncbi:hypothetical protein [Shouchella shacheensis]|uniref:spermine/spermidine synthase domain-containing protein n=1 Tax=Shouchella shacheensis TaxID=1649580 RepID=UPI00074044AF|nr:hypothetical protein [Shouchella shacheensis]
MDFERPTVIERLETPYGELQLQKRGPHFEVISNGTFLMASYNGESERHLVRAAFKKAHHPAHVLIGGLGVGYSLEEALIHEDVASVTVVEREEAIIRWNAEHFLSLTNNAVRHPKTRIVHDDISQWMRSTEATYDVICLDTDNGPDWLIHDDNRYIYAEAGLKRWRELLTPDGCVAFWSANASRDFEKLLASFFQEVKVVQVPDPTKRGEPDVVYLGSRRGRPLHFGRSNEKNFPREA